MWIFGTRRIFGAALNRKRREMIHRMVVLTSVSVFVVLALSTLVFDASSVPSGPGVLYKSEIPTALDLQSQNGKENSVDNLNPTEEKENLQLVLKGHHRVLQFTNTNDYGRDSFPSEIESETKNDEFIRVSASSKEYNDLRAERRLTANGGDSKVLQISAGNPPEYKPTDIFLDLAGQNTPGISDKDLSRSQSMFVSKQTVEFDDTNERRLAKNSIDLQPRKYVRHNKNNLNLAEQVVVERSYEKTPKPNRNASYRNGTSEVPTRRLPRAIIIGVKKSGTRALLEFLRIHPDIEGPGPEPHFFDRNYDRGLDWYRSLMPKTYKGQITIEKTPSYFITSEAPQRMFDMNPDVKLILVVRDPVTRAISDYCQAVSKRRMPPFEEIAMLDQRRGVVNARWGAIQIGLYYKHMEKWLQTFARKQIHLVDGQKLITEPAKELAKVERFLHLPSFITENHFYLNRFKGSFPCLIRRGKAHCLDERSKGRDHPKVKQSILKRLRTFYHPFNVKFYEMVGQDFQWSTA